MRRKRSLRGLGASADVHSKATITAAAEAREKLTSARQRAEKGMCGRALIAFRMGSRMVGRVDIERQHSGGNISTLLDILPSEELHKATQAIEKHCFVGGGLSGTRRRRSR